MGIAENIAEIRGEIARTAIESGRAPDAVRLLAVSKTFPASAAEEAYRTAGQLMFGENRVWELESKVPVLPAGLEWHLIGHLQSNKAAKAAALAAWIHSADSAKLLDKLESACAELGKKIVVLLEVNWTGEESKFGIRGEKNVLELAEHALTLPHLELRGLMTMAEIDAAEPRLRETFSGVRLLRDRMETEFRRPFPELSMGMSGDYRTAILEGATIVRIGTAIFGRR